MYKYPKYQFEAPVKVKYGIDSIEENITLFAEELGVKKALIVTDKGVQEAGIIKKIEKLLKKANIEINIFDKICPNPEDKIVMQGVDFFKQIFPDVILGVGGGSSIDSAKAIRAVAQAGGNINDYSGVDAFNNMKPRIPLIAVPTTAGTGSEMGSCAVITDTKRNIKFAVLDKSAMLPTISIVDPALTLTLPPSLTAQTGMDAFNHALEAYVIKTSSPITDPIALNVIELISKNIRIAWANGEDIMAREKLMYGSMMAGIVITNVYCGATHAIGEAVGAKCNLGHGLVIASFTPYVMKYNTPAVPEKMANIARAMGVNTEKMSILDAADAAWQETVRLVADLGIPRPSDLGIEKKELSNIAKLCLNNVSSEPNPRSMSEKDYLLFLEECLSKDLW